MNKIRDILTALLLVPLCAGASEEGIDDRTGLPRWDAAGDDVRVRLVQRLPDQTRAFFIGRGFNAAQVDRIAGHCVLQTIIYNDGGTPILLDIANWSARVDDRAGDATVQPRLMSDWQQEWTEAGVGNGPRIAFRWALFPNQQEFAPGDWNMGMTTWPVPPGSELDVHIRWVADGKPHELVVDNVRCAQAAANSAPNQ